MKDKIKLKSLKRLKSGPKKYVAEFEIITKNSKKRTKSTKFGAKGMSDYTIHKDTERRNRYINRHKKDLRTNDPTRAGYLSMYILWNKKTYKASLADYKRRLNAYNKTGKFPKNIPGSALKNKFGVKKVIINDKPEVRTYEIETTRPLKKTRSVIQKPTPKSKVPQDIRLSFISSDYHKFMFELQKLKFIDDENDICMMFIFRVFFKKRREITKELIGNVFKANPILNNDCQSQKIIYYLFETPDGNNLLKEINDRISYYKSQIKLLSKKSSFGTSEDSEQKRLFTMKTNELQDLQTDSPLEYEFDHDPFDPRTIEWLDEANELLNADDLRDDFWKEAIHNFIVSFINTKKELQKTRATNQIKNEFKNEEEKLNELIRKIFPGKSYSNKIVQEYFESSNSFGKVSGKAPDNVKNPKLYLKIKAKIQRDVKKKKRRWGAYDSGRLVREYKAAGGKYSGTKKSKTNSKTSSNLDRWYREKWIDACAWPRRKSCGRTKASIKSKVTYCRPSIIVDSNTPKTVQELSKLQIKKRCAKKSKNPRKIIRK